jgi:hypothetical protein
MAKKKPETVAQIVNRLPLLASCLYDLNLLPEVLATLKKRKDSKEYWYMMSLVNHFALLEHTLKGKRRSTFQEITHVWGADMDGEVKW